MAYIDDPVTTTDELIPSGETSSFRSDPYALSEFALSRKVPEYVGRAKEVRTLEKARQDHEANEDLIAIYEHVKSVMNISDSVEEMLENTSIGSTIYANKPGDGSAREQAASCQRVLGAAANIALEYATKRYRSNVMNWGMLPFVTTETDAKKLAVGSYVWVPNVLDILDSESDDFKGYVITGDQVEEIELHMNNLEPEERKIIKAGCLINHYANN